MFFHKLKGALIFHNQQVVCLVAALVDQQLVVKYYKSFCCPGFTFLDDDHKKMVLERVLPKNRVEKIQWAIRVDVAKALLSCFSVDSAVSEKNLLSFVDSYMKNEMALSPSDCLYDFFVVFEEKALLRKKVQLVAMKKNFCWNVLSQKLFYKESQFSSFSLVEYDFLKILYDDFNKEKEEAVLFLVSCELGVLGGVVSRGSPVWLHFQSFSVGGLPAGFVPKDVFYGDVVSCLSFFKKSCPVVDKVCLVGFPGGFLPPGFLLKMGCVELLCWDDLFSSRAWRVDGCFFKSVDFLMSVSVLKRVFCEG